MFTDILQDTASILYYQRSVKLIRIGRILNIIALKKTNGTRHN